MSRPRSRAVDRAILDATRDLLARNGYQALTIEAVAAEAGVGRPSVYRRHPTKADLVAAALLELAAGEPPAVPDGTRDALLALLDLTATALGNRGGMTILGTLLAQESRDPELVATFRDRVFRPRHAIVREVVERGIARGEVDAGTDVQATIDLLFGALLARAVLGQPPTPAWLASVVDTVWTGIARQAGEDEAGRPRA